MSTLDSHISAHAARPAQAPHAFAKTVVDAIGDLLTRFLDWQDRARQRRQLLSLSDHALQDFGASRADAEGEGGKPFWRR